MTKIFQCILTRQCIIDKLDMILSSFVDIESQYKSCILGLYWFIIYFLIIQVVKAQNFPARSLHYVIIWNDFYDMTRKICYVILYTKLWQTPLLTATNPWAYRHALGWQQLKNHWKTPIMLVVQVRKNGHGIKWIQRKMSKKLKVFKDSTKYT